MKNLGLDSDEIWIQQQPGSGSGSGSGFGFSKMPGIPWIQIQHCRARRAQLFRVVISLDPGPDPVKRKCHKGVYHKRPKTG